ncbi:hypothetical protein BV22DRAFT_1132097 [Leucogyrophana mollusca]|uniref:Uncharacterized protein n=1 Tax=Leucogyrophana mollusca TaxID=85980 RepID=A0ACB8B8B4_9AGAM|nr:hypothetical protein BV22DRAFT_1132097 [Leucogyrophana mollusca]
MDNYLPRLEELKLAFEGRHAPPEQRLIIRALTGKDPDSKKAAAFAAALDMQDITRYALEKFLETGDKGAVVFNIKYPYMDTPTFSRLFWIPRQAFVSSLHPTIPKRVTEYDPAKNCCVMLMLPSSDYRSAQVWSTTVLYSLPRNYPLWNDVRELKQDWEENMRVWEKEGLLTPHP